MKKSIVNIFASSVFAATALLSASAVASGSQSGEIDIAFIQASISSEIKENGRNALKNMMENDDLGRRIEFRNGFHALQKRVAEDRVESDEGNLAAEQELQPEDDAALPAELLAPRLEQDELVQISDLTAGVIQ